MALEIKVDTARLQRILKTSPEELDRVMPGVALRIGLRFRGNFYASRLRGPPGVRGTRRGLMSQFRVTTTGTKFDRLRLDVGTRSPIAALHERGGTTVAKSGGNLAIPFSSLSKAQKKRFRDLVKQSRAVFNARSSGFDLVKKSGRKVKSLFAIVAKDGRAFLAESVGGKARILGHLQKRVYNKPLLGFVGSWGRFRPTAVKLFNQGIGFALAAARKKAGK
jgi:hypothetical protein